MKLQGTLQALLDQVNLVLRRGDAVLGLLLKDMQDINRIQKLPVYTARYVSPR